MKIGRWLAIADETILFSLGICGFFLMLAMTCNAIDNAEQRSHEYRMATTQSTR